MLKDTEIELRNLDGTPIRDGEAAVTMKAVVVNALLSQPPGENPGGEEKATRYKLALSVHEGGEKDLTPEEIVLIKKLVGQVYAPLVVGQVYEWCNT